MQNEIYHHGILGQKWGVRRYQNFDGSLTKAGLKRYHRSLETYNKADAKYKTLKNEKASKADLDNAKINRRQAKRRLNKDYKHLKQDKLADQGKSIYASGKTITGNNAVSNALAKIGGLSITAAAYNHQYKVFGDDRVTKALAAIGGVSIAGSGVKGLSDRYQAKRLRAYYNHTSTY